MYNVAVSSELCIKRHWIVFALHRIPRRHLQRRRLRASLQPARQKLLLREGRGRPRLRACLGAFVVCLSGKSFEQLSSAAMPGSTAL